MDQQIKEIITRVLDGSATTNDKDALVEWMNFKEENRRELEKIEGIWNALEILKNKEKFGHESGYDTFLENLKKESINHSITSPTKKLYYYWSIAASILLIVGLAYFFWDSSNPKVENITYFELSTPKGSHTKLTLIDGSTVLLNAGSKLRYPNKFKDGTRTVYLDGEAFFDVAKNPEKPFIVQTPEIKVKALGTSFNVKAYSKEGSVETTLIEGTVIVEGNFDKKKFTPVKLSPKQRVTFVKKAGKLLLLDKEKELLEHKENDIQSTKREKESLIVTKNVDTEVYTSWIDNELLFDNETFESIAYKLERRYGATIIFKDEKFKSYRFSGKFPEISIERVLNALQFASPFKYDIKQDTISIN